ncbi:MAG: TPR Domain containing protein [Candidatus Moranbacteria bacterium GW2011_GWF2_34_56]|nr:MAG: TPR Domain containing protein [Candidatus Moranbacteria bacterium GW2011_GWF1_34_10]KKP64390.1 MAG: TPR Domain containing protein [Candidatus Moranbacteria bacterium GW2011_GWF2_34_56]HBI16980.1 hypothetical protein [Candidatus Moranbacteria bacterium]
MQNKKLLAIFVIAFFTVSFGLLYFFVVNKMTDKSGLKNNKPVNSEKLTCQYASDDEAYVEATKKPDIAICDCIKDKEKINSCREMAMNNELYSQAIGQYDPKICENISVDEIRKSCLSATSDAVSYMKKNDPLRLANIYKNVHSENAIAEFEGLVSSDSENIENFFSLAMAYAEKGLSEQQQGRERSQYLDKAFETINKAKEIDLNNSEVYRIEAYIYEIKPDLDKALEMYDKSIKLDNNNILAYIGRAHANEMKGALHLALDDLKKAAELDKDKKEISIYSRLCNLESSRTDLIGEAKRNCEIVIGLESIDVISKSLAYQVLGDIYVDDKKLDEATSYFLKAKAMTPNDASIYVSMAKLRMLQLNYIEAEKQIEKAIDINPTKSSSYLVLAKALIMQKKYDEAIAVANKGLSLVDEDVSLLESNKAALKRDLYYIISATYNERGDKDNEMKFEEMGNNVMKSN